MSDITVDNKQVKRWCRKLARRYKKDSRNLTVKDHNSKFDKSVSNNEEVYVE